MANLQYIGARYVPILYTNSIDASSNWESGVSYEPLTIVTYLDDSYTSKITVPASIGNPADNPIYWVKTGNYNAALTHLQNDVDSIHEQIGNFVSPQMFGAVGDGTTDDSAAFNAAIQTGRPVIVPNGTYYIASDLRLDGNKSLIGLSENGGTNCRLIMAVGASVIISGNYNVLKGFELYSPTLHYGTAIYFTDTVTRQNKIADLSILRMEYAIKSDITLWCTSFENIYINGCVNGITNTALVLCCDFTNVYFSYVHKLLDITKFECCNFNSCNFGIVKGNSFTITGNCHVSFNDCNFECDIVVDTAGALFTIDAWYVRFINCAFKLQGEATNYGFDTTGQCKGLLFEECSLLITGGSMPRSQFWGDIRVGLDGAIIMRRTFNFPPLTSNPNAYAGMHSIDVTDQINMSTTPITVATVVIPPKSQYCITASAAYTNARPKVVSIETSDHSVSAANCGNEAGSGDNLGVSATISGYTPSGFTATIQMSYIDTSANRFYIKGFYDIVENTFIP